MRINQFVLTMDALAENESFARTVVASFCLAAKPTLEEVSDVKTAVSEAVTNAIVHAYAGQTCGKIKIKCKLSKNQLYISIKDDGVGIEDIEKAKEPFYTSKPNEERSGMGFTVMESFMDSLKVESVEGKGTTVYMVKTFGKELKESQKELGSVDDAYSRRNR